jgi:uncharacterized protein YbaP (TraB family)
MPLSLRTFFRPLWLLALLAATAGPVCAEAASGPKASSAPSISRSAPEPRPAIWLLADEDTKIYLFGTVHVLPPGFRWRSPAVDRIIADADELVLETYEEPGKAEYRDAHDGFLLRTPVPILERVPSERRAALKAAIGATRVPIVYFDRLQTWAAGMMLGMAQLLGSYGADGPGEAPGVEVVLEQSFRAAGKPISSVEDPAVVVASLNALPAKVQMGLLLDTIDPGKDFDGASADEDRLWASGQVEAIGAALLKEFPPSLFEPLLTRRNRAWSEWLARRLEKPGIVLFAVGAGHLAGKQSVQAMLSGRGLTVTRLD